VPLPNQHRQITPHGFQRLAFTKAQLEKLNVEAWFDRRQQSKKTDRRDQAADHTNQTKGLLRLQESFRSPRENNTAEDVAPDSFLLKHSKYNSAGIGTPGETSSTRQLSLARKQVVPQLQLNMAALQNSQLGSYLSTKEPDTLQTGCNAGYRLTDRAALYDYQWQPNLDKLSRVTKERQAVSRMKAGIVGKPIQSEERYINRLFQNSKLKLTNSSPKKSTFNPREAVMKLRTSSETRRTCGSKGRMDQMPELQSNQTQPKSTNKPKITRNVLKDKYGFASSLKRLHITNENLFLTHYSPVLESKGHKTHSQCKSRMENKLKRLVGHDVGGSTTTSRKNVIYNTFNEKGVTPNKTPCMQQPLTRLNR
jgi:hypothetical protein